MSKRRENKRKLKSIDFSIWSGAVKDPLESNVKIPWENFENKSLEVLTFYLIGLLPPEPRVDFPEDQDNERERRRRFLDRQGPVVYWHLSQAFAEGKILSLSLLNVVIYAHATPFIRDRLLDRVKEDIDAVIEKRDGKKRGLFRARLLEEFAKAGGMGALAKSENDRNELLNAIRKNYSPSDFQALVEGKIEKKVQELAFSKEESPSSGQLKAELICRAEELLSNNVLLLKAGFKSFLAQPSIKEILNQFSKQGHDQQPDTIKDWLSGYQFSRG